MNTTKYLIVGAGMTGDMAAKGIREHDSEGSITMIGADPHPTYKRPLLTKGLWQGTPEEKIWREAAEGVELVTGRLAPDLLLGCALPQALRQQRSLVRGMWIGADHRDRALGVVLSDAFCRHVAGHTGADDQVLGRVHL